MRLSLRVLPGVAAVAGAAAAAFASLAWAEPSPDAWVEAKPGLWNWKQETSILGVFNSKEDNLECLIPEEANIKLSKLARDLDEGCSAADVSSLPNGYAFKLVCTGDISGKANMTLTTAEDSISIRGKGSARWGIVIAGLSMKADATRVGECSADQITKARERWQREQAQR
jgi:hypothetical protein